MNTDPVGHEADKRAGHEAGHEADTEAGGWPRWAAAVRDALARKSLSVNAAAEYLGVRNTTLRAEAHAIQVATELRSAVGTIAEAVAHASELAFSDAGARVAGILLSQEGADLQVTLRRAYRGRRYPVHLTTYVDATTSVDGDRLADVAMLAAVDAWRHMHSYGFVPAAVAAGGRLRMMFDRHGRPEGDPRPSMVAEARRMPARR